MADKRAIVLALATALAIPAEGLRQYAYRDPPGIWTTCYGHTGTDVDRTRKYSLDECEALLNKDMLNAIDTVNQCRPKLPIKVLAAFADASYNLGPAIACNTAKSTAARLLAAGELRQACLQLPRWSRARVAGVSVELPGLVKRRNAEMKLCLEGLNEVPANPL